MSAGISLITVTGDEAGAETYFIATLLYPAREPDGGEIIGQLGGRYVDRLVREAAGWRIRDRVCVREWSHSHPVAGDWLANAGFVGMQRGPGDPSYAALGLTHSGNPWLREVTAPA